MPAGRPPIFKTAEEMQEAVDLYFRECKETETPYTIGGLCLALGMNSRDTLCQYAKNGKFSDTVKVAKQKVEADVERRLLSGGNATGAIFWMKNNAGWKDKQEIEHSGAVGTHELSEEELIAIATRSGN